MDWYCLTVSAEQVAQGKVLQYREAFQAAFAEALGPRTMALFRKDTDTGEVKLYATPEAGKHAAGLLDEWGCTRCHAPQLLGLELLVGHNEITYYMT